MLSEVLDYIPGETIIVQKDIDSFTYVKLAIVLALSSAVAIGLSLLVGYCSKHIL